MKIGLAYWLAHLVNSRSLVFFKDTVAIVLFVDVVHIDSMEQKSGRVLGDRYNWNRGLQ